VIGFISTSGVTNYNKKHAKFRTELENPIVERDILELEQKIKEFRTERFRMKNFAVFG
jgi:hypothetical protein